MRKLYKKIIFWIYLKLHTMSYYIGISQHNIGQDILKIDPFDIKEGDKKIQRMRSRSQLLEKFYAGKRDEKIIQHFYEVLKKADSFMRNASAHKMAVAADKYGTNYGMEDIYGRKHEHYGFFDDKHKHAGKTLGEVLEMEMEDRRTKDDNFKIAYILNNKPIEVGLTKITDVIKETEKEDADFEYEVADILYKSKQFEFPLKPIRNDKNVINKIEELTEYLHVKKIGDEMIQLEFFIPLKFKTDKIEDNSEIFLDIININGIFAKDIYGDMKWFGINKYIKRIIHNDSHEVWKFEGVEMQQMG